MGGLDVLLIQGINCHMNDETPDLLQDETQYTLYCNYLSVYTKWCFYWSKQIWFYMNPCLLKMRPRNVATPLLTCRDRSMHKNVGFFMVRSCIESLLVFLLILPSLSRSYNSVLLNPRGGVDQLDLISLLKKYCDLGWEIATVQRGALSVWCESFEDSLLWKLSRGLKICF